MERGGDDPPVVRRYGSTKTLACVRLAAYDGLCDVWLAGRSIVTYERDSGSFSWRIEDVPDTFDATVSYLRVVHGLSSGKWSELHAHPIEMPFDPSKISATRWLLKNFELQQELIAATDHHYQALTRVTGDPTGWALLIHPDTISTYKDLQPLACQLLAGQRSATMGRVMVGTVTAASRHAIEEHRVPDQIVAYHDGVLDADDEMLPALVARLVEKQLGGAADKSDLDTVFATARAATS